MSVVVTLNPKEYVSFEKVSDGMWTYRGMIVWKHKSPGFGTYYRLYPNAESGDHLAEGKTLAELRGIIAQAANLVSHFK